MCVCWSRLVILAPVLGGVAGTTLVPLLMATTMAYCATGYVKDELYHPFIKWCVGGCCNFFVSVFSATWYLYFTRLSYANILKAIYLINTEINCLLVVIAQL